MVQPDEHRNLSQHGQTAEDRVEVVLALQLLDLQRHPLTILAVLLLQRLDLWLQFLHLARCPDLLDERPVQHGPQREHQEHHRERPGEEVARPQQGAEELVPEPHDSRYRVVHVVEAEPVKH